VHYSVGVNFMDESDQGTPQTYSPDVPDDVFLVDVREDDEWAAGHAPDAVHVRLGELPVRTGELPADREIYVICRTGARSDYAVRMLAGHGRQGVNVADGMMGWAVAGKPMVSETGAEPFVL